MSRTLAVLFLCAGASAFAADPPAAIDTKAFDKSIVASLRDIHDRGADLYNLSKDYPAAFRLYEGSLLTVKPLLSHRPDVQKAIDAGLSSAGKETDPARKAFLLHETIEKVRAELKVAPMAPKVEPKPEPKPMPKPVESKVELKTYKVAAGTADATAKLLQSRFPTATIKVIPESDQILVAGSAVEQAAIAKWLEDKKAADPILKPKPKEPAPLPRPKEPAAKTATVSGKVMVQGKPLAEGMVTFVSLAETKMPLEFSTKVADDGSYSVKDLPEGKYSVAVSSKKDGAVPAKFASVKTSGLTFQVQTGANKFDIELK